MSSPSYNQIDSVLIMINPAEYIYNMRRFQDFKFQQTSFGQLL